MPKAAPPPNAPAEADALAAAQAHGLYNPAHEHDACGVGFVAHIKGEQVRTASSRRAC